MDMDTDKEKKKQNKVKLTKEERDKLMLFLIHCGCFDPIFKKAGSSCGKDKTAFFFTSYTNEETGEERTVPNSAGTLSDVITSGSVKRWTNVFFLPNRGKLINREKPYKHVEEGRHIEEIFSHHFFYLDFDLKNEEGDHFTGDDLLRQKQLLLKQIKTSLRDLKCSFIVESRNGYHLYWSLLPQEWLKVSPKTWRFIQFLLYDYAKSYISPYVDIAVKKSNQLLRLPWSFHQKKDNTDLFRVEIIYVQSQEEQIKLLLSNGKDGYNKWRTAAQGNYSCLTLLKFLLKHFKNDTTSYPAQLDSINSLTEINRLLESDELVEAPHVSPIESKSSSYSSSSKSIKASLNQATGACVDLANALKQVQIDLAKRETRYAIEVFNGTEDQEASFSSIKTFFDTFITPYLNKNKATLTKNPVVKAISEFNVNYLTDKEKLFFKKDYSQFVQAFSPKEKDKTKKKIFVIINKWFNLHRNDYFSFTNFFKLQKKTKKVSSLFYEDIDPSDYVYLPYKKTQLGEQYFSSHDNIHYSNILLTFWRIWWYSEKKVFNSEGLLTKDLCKEEKEVSVEEEENELFTFQELVQTKGVKAGWSAIFNFWEIFIGIDINKEEEKNSWQRRFDNQQIIIRSLFAKIVRSSKQSKFLKRSEQVLEELFLMWKEQQQNTKVDFRKVKWILSTQLVADRINKRLNSKSFDKQTVDVSVKILNYLNLIIFLRKVKAKKKVALCHRDLNEIQFHIFDEQQVEGLLKDFSSSLEKTENELKSLTIKQLTQEKEDYNFSLTEAYQKMILLKQLQIFRDLQKIKITTLQQAFLKFKKEKIKLLEKDSLEKDLPLLLQDSSYSFMNLF